MSTRSGQFVTLTELCNEVGTDAARFFYVQRKPEQHMDFDLDLAKSQSSENPVYYVQYAHARICSVFRQLNDKGITRPTTADLVDYSLLTEEHEQQLINGLSKYPEVVGVSSTISRASSSCVLSSGVSKLFSYLIITLIRLLRAAAGIREARLMLIDATRQVIANGLGLLGVTTPEQM